MYNDRDSHPFSLDVLLHAVLGGVLAISLAWMVVAPHVHRVVM